jgi:nitrite reductase/ring-hydroxylating ferredoxin subunit
MADEARASVTSQQAFVPLTRREFLNYAWLSSLGFVFLVGFGGAAYLFAFPRFKAGEFGGLFVLGKASDVLPKPNDPPIHNQAGKFWLSNVNGMIVALYDVCVHLGCLYEWQPVTGRFECPCHGSKYQKVSTSKVPRRAVSIAWCFHSRSAVRRLPQQTRKGVHFQFHPPRMSKLWLIRARFSRASRTTKFNNYRRIYANLREEYD